MAPRPCWAAVYSGKKPLLSAASISAPAAISCVTMSLGGPCLSQTAFFKGVIPPEHCAFTFAPARSNAATIASRSRIFSFHVPGVTV